MENLLKTLRNCPNTLEYLTPDPESSLSYDIDELSKGLPVLMTSIDTASLRGYGGGQESPERARSHESGWPWSR